MSIDRVLSGEATYHVEQGDCLQLLPTMPEKCVDLCFFSPPYERARTYLEDGQNLGIARDTEEWVAWMVDVFRVCLRVTKGLVACVCEGQTKDYRYSGGPVLLWADLIRAGITTRKAPIYHRVGIPGSGGPDWLRNDYEFILCATNGGQLPWSDNTAGGQPPKWAPGGAMSHRMTNGQKVNQRRATRGHANGDTKNSDSYVPPKLANPGNIIKCKVGGGLMGSSLVHLNEAGFPESLCEFFIRSFAPPGGIVLDPFAGSGTTAAVAVRWKRRAIGIDLRQSQVDLALKRIGNETPLGLLIE